MACTTIDISEDLMARIEQVAGEEKLRPEELVHEAVEEHLRRKRRRNLFERAERRTRELGIPETQVDAIVQLERDQANLGR